MWQSLLKALGSVLSFFFDVIPNYGIAIILLTVAVRIALLPLTLKQTRSMQAMQQIQPQVKALQQKYKGDRQKLNEELMKLYKEHQVNPLGGCLPLLLQLPVFIALYSVLRGDPGQVAAGVPSSVAHLPAGSDLAGAIKAHTANFLGMNLACSPSVAGRGRVNVPGSGEFFCGSGWMAAVPFIILVVLMVATTWYQQKQMQGVSGQPAQAQMLMKIMPIFLGFISWTIPAGVLVYWVTTNVWQVGQQHVILTRRAQAEVEGSARPIGTPPKPSGGKKNAGSRKKRRKR